MNRGLPSISYALPLGSEAKWSDLLAVLIATDPDPLSSALGRSVSLEHVKVNREVASSRSSRPDIVLERTPDPPVVIEVKVLSGLGARQLERYEAAVPEAAAFVLIFPERLTIDLRSHPNWRSLPWEHLLSLYAESQIPWVSETAQAWLSHLQDAMPNLDGRTRWNDLREGEDFVIALRARMSWIFGELDPPDPIEHDLVSSSAGVSWVARMRLPAQRRGYRVLAEVEERLPVRDFPKFAGERTPVGPSIRVCLIQEGVTTSANFDWEYLLAMWPLMREERSDWVEQPARPRAKHDRDGHARIVAKGGPAYLGIGFGEAQTRQSNQCLFGARFQLPADVRLCEVVSTMHGLGDLLVSMSQIP